MRIIDDMVRDMSRSVDKQLARTAFFSITVIILLFWLNWWMVDRMVAAGKERADVDLLKAAGLQLASVIENDDSSLLFGEWNIDDADPFFDDDYLLYAPQTLYYDQLTTNVFRARQSSDLMGLWVVDIWGRVLVDAVGEFAVGEYIPEPAEAWPFIDDAIAGEATVAPPGVGLAGAGRTAWVPLRNSGGRPVALLRLEAWQKSGGESRLLRTWILLVGAICTALLLAVGLLQSRTLRRAAEMEQAMAQEDRLRALGTLAAGLAHELRNPLGILRATAEEIGEEVAGRPDLEALAKDSIEEIDRLNDLIGHVLQFAKPAEKETTGEKPECQVREVVEAVLHFVRKNMKSQQIEIAPPEFQQDFSAAIDHNALRQVLLNLLFNASDAIAAANEKGSITLKVKSLRHDRLQIEVHDSGPGIPPEEIGRVFDPFFSGKEQGAGLGLSISRGIAERAGGALELESKAGAGTTARIILNIAARKNA